MPAAKHVQHGMARKLYVEDGLVAEVIAKALKVDKSTVHLWINKGGWKECREELMGSRKSIYEMALAILKEKLSQLERMDAKAISPGLIDSLSKLFKIVDASRESVRVFECAVIVAEELTAFVRRTVPDEATRSRVFEVWEAFLDEVKD